MTEIGKPEPVDSVNLAFIRSVARMLGYDISDRSNMITGIHFYPREIEVQSVDVTGKGAVFMARKIPIHRPRSY